VDAEQLFDGQTIIVYYLGEPTDKLGPLAVELSKTADNRRVQFQPIETLQTTETEVSSHSSEKDRNDRSWMIKESSQFLRGTIMDELSCNTDKFSVDDVSLLKFHGTYQQDDRGARKGRVPGVGKRHMFMERLKIPGGRLTAGQLLGTPDLCDRFADGTLRVTTRQGLQLHGVAKGNLRCAEFLGQFNCLFPREGKAARETFQRSRADAVLRPRLGYRLILPFQSDNLSIFLLMISLRSAPY
jgi:hypothetical protein